MGTQNKVPHKMKNKVVGYIGLDHKSVLWCSIHSLTDVIELLLIIGHVTLTVVHCKEGR